MPTAPGPSLTARFRRASREVEAVSSALVQARLVGLFADRQLYGRALGLFWLVHKQLDLCLKENISRGQPGAGGRAARAGERTQGQAVGRWVSELN